MGILLMIKEGRNLNIESIPDQPLEPSFPIVDPDNTGNDGWFGTGAFGQAIFAGNLSEQGAA
jgi:hypothetical protein|tara:strand:- start:1281 stop:1466 length:186 start_codon:yes stop_codon:yes gene_type:complete